MKKMEATDADLESIASFSNELNNFKRKTSDWLWEYKGIYPDSHVFTVIKDEHGIVATQGMIPIYLYIRGKRVLTGKSESTLLAPRYRGSDLFQGLYELAVSLCGKRKMKCLWGYTGAGKAFRKFGFATYPDIMRHSVVLLRFQHDSPAARADGTQSRRIFKSFAVFAAALYCYVLRKTCLCSDARTEVRNSMLSPDDIERFFDRRRMLDPDLVHLDMNVQYLRWRVYDNPNLKYKSYFSYRDDCLKAYAFVNVTQGDRAYLIDFAYESVSSARKLIGIVLEELISKGFMTLVYYGNHRNPLARQTFRFLRRFGFLQRKDGVDFVLRNLSIDDESALRDVSNWYMNGLWTEGFTQ